ncbi:phage replication protein, partial [Klebsiella pneumoniae]
YLTNHNQIHQITNNIPKQYNKKPQIQQITQIINNIFNQLLTTFPTNLTNHNQNKINKIHHQ